VKKNMTSGGDRSGDQEHQRQRTDLRPEVAMQHQYAQTHLQLYAQLRQSGYTASDIALVHRAYALGVTLFASAFRGSGKPLLCHLVGTASILASLRESPTLITAALQHAAYALGDFGTGRLGMTPAKRDRVQNAVSPEVEDLVARYTSFEWNKETISTILSGVRTMNAIKRDVLVIRLANELEDHLDLGVLYCRNAEHRREYIRSPLNKSVKMAGQLGLPELAAALDDAFSEALSAELPLSGADAREYTFVQPPASYTLRPIIVSRLFIDRHPTLARLVRPLVLALKPRFRRLVLF
jgi:(p)ppGpp synthase/HD superfamily hydrolase